MEPEIKYMKAALREAGKAEKLEEVPIGCVIVQNDKIIAQAIHFCKFDFQRTRPPFS